MKPSKELQALRDKIEEREQAHLSSWRGKFGTVTPGVAAAFKAYENAGRAMQREARTAAAQLRTLRTDDTVYPLGRQRMERELRDATESQLKKLKDEQDFALDVLTKELMAAALPRVDRERELFARDEARMILDASPSPGVAMIELAGRSDELAAVVTGSWGESYLRARGERRPTDVHAGVQSAALAANVQHTDKTVSAAAAGHAALTELAKATACTRSIVKSVMESVDEVEDAAPAPEGSGAAA
jgi:hypothetical protein